MKNIFVLPTSGESRLHLANNKTIIKSLEPTGKSNLYNSVPVHIYITNNDDIKEGDWFIELDLKGTRSSYANKPYLCDIGNTGNFILTKESGNFPFPENCRKIILAADPKLISDGVQSIDDDFLNWFVNNSCEYVEVTSLDSKLPKKEVNGYFTNETLEVYKIILPKKTPKKKFEYIGECKGNNDNGCFMDSPAHNCGCFTRVSKQEILEKKLLIEASKKVWNEQHPNPIEMALFGAKWQQEQVIKLLKENDYENEAVFEFLNEQFKNK